MLNPLTAAKLDHGLASLALDQLEGKAPPPGEVSLAELARRAGVSEATVQKVERIALAKVAARLAEGNLPPHLARRIARQLSNPTSRHP